MMAQTPSAATIAIMARLRPGAPDPDAAGVPGASAAARMPGIIRPGMDTRPGMDGQSENPGEPRSEHVAAALAPPDELETDAVPDPLISEFASLTTPYCWVITEDAVAGYDGAGPSAVGKSGPGQAVAEDVAEALTAGRFFRLVDGKGRELAIGRLYDPSGGNELAPLNDFGRQNLGALNIEFRAEGGWQAA
jgi:hypothetical protein